MDVAFKSEIYASRIAKHTEYDKVTDALLTCLSWKTEKDAVAVFDCPTCGHKLQAGYGGLICNNAMCSWGYGTVLDLLAVLYKGDWKQAIRWTAHSFGWLDIVDDEAAIDLMAYKYQTERAIKDLTLRSHYIREESLQDVLVSAWAERYSVSLTTWPRSLLVMTFEELKKISTLLVNGPRLPNWGDASILIVSVHMRDFGRTGHLTAVNPLYESDNPVILNIDATAPVHYFGLLEMPPWQQEVHVCFNMFAASTLNAEFQTGYSGSYAVAAHFQGPRDGPCYVPPRSICVHMEALDSTPNFIDTAAFLRRNHSDIRMVSGYKEEPFLRNKLPSASWKEFVFNYVLEGVRSSGGALDVQSLGLLRKATLTDAEKDELVKELRSQMYDAAADELEGSVEPEVVYNDGTGELLKSPGGFSVIRKNNPTLYPVTNFVLEPVETLVSLEGRSSYVMECLFDDAKFRVSLPEDRLYSHQEMEAVVRREAPFREDLIPTVTDRRHINLVQDYLKWRLSSKPVQRGVDSFGWNNRKDRYQAPWGVLRKEAEGWDQAKILRNPESPWLGYFGEMSPPAPVDRIEWTPAGSALACQVLGVIAGCFAGWDPLSQVSGLNADALAAGFSRLSGQTEIVDIEGMTKARLAQANFNGFPVAVKGDREAVSGWVLYANPEGEDEPLPAEEIDAVLTVLINGIQSCIDGSVDLKTLYRRPRSLDKSRTLQLLGAALGKRMYGESVGWEEPANHFSTLEEWLGSISKDKLKTTVVHAVNDNLLHIKVPEDVDRVFFMTELKRWTGKKVDVLEDGLLAIPAYEGINLLEYYYGYVPELGFKM